MKYCVKGKTGITFSCHKTKRAANKAVLRLQKAFRKINPSKFRVVKTSKRERKMISAARRAGVW